MFVTSYTLILDILDTINPNQYSQTRNYTNGSVTRLSPYLTHGVISLSYVRDFLLTKYPKEQCQKILQELAWKEYFQRVWETLGDGIFVDVRNPQTPITYISGVPDTFITKNSGSISIDSHLTDLENVGYVHNHGRMWIAMYATNILKYHWRDPAFYMYYYLLDGDLASNTLSWQWICGTFSAKKYISNQQTINMFDEKNMQHNNFLDVPYEQIENSIIDSVSTVPFEHAINCTIFLGMNTFNRSLFDTSVKTFIYHMWNLDPLWHQSEKGNRVLVVEPSFLHTFPMSEKRLDFIFQLSKNIPNIQIYVGEFSDFLKEITREEDCVTRYYPAITHWNITQEPRDYLFPNKIWKSGGFMSWYNK